MASILKLPDIWRVIRELDLASIRRDAEGRFRLVILSEKDADAEAVVSLLSGGPAHPWLEVRAPSDLATGREEDGMTITAVLAITDQPALTPAGDTAIQRLARAGVPVVTVVHGSGRPVDAVARAGETMRTVVPALDDAALAPIAAALVGAVPLSLRLALARQLPPLRDAVFDLLIDETAKANATYAFTTAVAEAVPILDVPLNLADILVLTKNQLLMGYKIALGAGKSGRARDVIGEVVGVVGGGFLFRQAARQLVGLIPVAGLIPKVAIAYTGTWAIGRAVVVWATQGRRVSPATLRRLSRDAAGRGRAFARGLLSARSSRSASAK
ncbi:MAG: hypothetical protein DMF77_04990 [Acidobacteria bacterium]|nr:MAG: hypothetical protein DMF77_04990 [Acidobacteriota bacterium]